MVPLINNNSAVPENSMLQSIRHYPAMDAVHLKYAL